MLLARAQSMYGMGRHKGGEVVRMLHGEFVTVSVVQTDLIGFVCNLSVYYPSSLLRVFVNLAQVRLHLRPHPHRCLCCHRIPHSPILCCLHLLLPPPLLLLRREGH